jgi:hypothetical protein
MEKETKTRTAKKTMVAELNATEPNKTVGKKKTGASAVSVMNGNGHQTNGSALKTNGTYLQKAAPRRKTTSFATAMNVSHDDIAKLAHCYWAERGHQHGNHVEDWLRAERELIGKAS